MLKRKIMNDLLEWKNRKNKKSLLLIGARQVGKTYIVKEFAKEYKNVVYINFERQPDTKSFFDVTLDPKIIIDKIRTHRDYINVDFSGKVLYIFDEIQACPAAITALKFFTEDKYDVIGTGSLLGVGLKRVSSYPVGYVEELQMYPLDFEEFLWASGIEDVSNIINLINNEDSISQAIHDDYMLLFKQFMVVGGMPEVVESFVEKKPYKNVLNIQKRIVTSYRNDVAKYSDNNIKERTRECFESIPFQLAKENKKFQYRYVSNGGRSKDYEDSIRWLLDAGIVYRCNCVSNLELPLQAYAEPSIFKMYFLDTGLLISMLDEGCGEMILNGDLKIYKGAIYENMVACILKSIGYNLFYYKKDNKWELDFIINLKNDVVPIEVKSSDNTKSKSLNSLIDNKAISKAIKVSSLNNNSLNIIKNLPLYLLPFIKNLKF